LNDSSDALCLTEITKGFEGHTAVKALSLRVPRGSVFGLLGPNGAGKTTTLRMVMDVLAPDSGRIEIFGRAVDAAARDRIGYMPEERGLYPRMVVEDQLVFLAELKGLARAEALRRVAPWLERLGLADWRRRKLNELSKGMQQKVQLVATLLHAPELLILDEPMSGLDPVGMDLVRDLLLDLQRGGTTLILSSHQMETVERMCDRVALIHRGELLLAGTVRDVKREHGGKRVAFEVESGDTEFLASLPGVTGAKTVGARVELDLREEADPQAVLRAALQSLTLRRFEIVEPSLHEVFVRTVTQAGVAA
jgi:ABC-2 type transport system ATP-binding protein